MNISQKYHDPVMLKSFLNSYNFKYPRRRFINPAGVHNEGWEYNTSILKNI